MAALAKNDKEQLQKWFASQRRRREPPPGPLAFPLSAAALFAAPAAKTGGSLGVDFVVAKEPYILADLGVLPVVDGRPQKRTLRLAQRMTDGGIAGVLWNCGRALAFMLPRLPEWTEGRFGGRVLELGCGTGLVGTACWLRGAREVAMTDLPAALGLARANAAANVGEAAGLRVAPLAWGDPLPPALAGPWDVVVAADCLYDAAALPALLRTLAEAAGARTVVYLAYKRRVDEREAPFFAELERRFERVAFSAADAVPAEWRGTGLHLCRATGRRPDGRSS